MKTSQYFWTHITRCHLLVGVLMEYVIVGKYWGNSMFGTKFYLFFTFSIFYFLGSYLPLMFLNAFTHLLFIMLVGLLIRLKLKIRFWCFSSRGKWGLIEAKYYSLIMSIFTFFDYQNLPLFDYFLLPQFLLMIRTPSKKLRWNVEKNSIFTYHSTKHN